MMRGTSVLGVTVSRDHMVSDVQRTEDALASSVLMPDQRGDLESHVTEMKRQADAQTAQ
jgi:hypothetical protein